MPFGTFKENSKKQQQMNTYTLFNADCLEAMKQMPDNSVDCIVTDPPYGLSFMGKKWDYDIPSVGIWEEALRIAKHGAHLIAFAGSRTFHRMACRIEDAGWECRDTLIYMYGSGFPKSMDISKAIDKRVGADRTEIIGYKNQSDMRGGALMETQGKPRINIPITAPASEEAKKWEGWGTCLKPAFEPIVLARKPVEGSIVDNVLKHGVGGINIDGCRVTVNPDDDVFAKNPHTRSKGTDSYATNCYGKYKAMERDYDPSIGRFPANLIHDGSDEVLACFPDNVKGGTWQRTEKARHFQNNGEKTNCVCGGHDKSIGSAARFFYCAKASRRERGEGNLHPTVKPLALMEYLVKLIAPQGAVVLDPFMGSGTTGVAAMKLGRNFIGIEKEPAYFEIAQTRIGDVQEPSVKQDELFD